MKQKTPTEEYQRGFRDACRGIKPQEKLTLGDKLFLSELYENAKQQGRKDAIDEILKIIDKEKYSKDDEWLETFESVFQDGYNKAIEDIKDKIAKEMKNDN